MGNLLPKSTGVLEDVAPQNTLGANKHDWLHPTYFKDVMQYTVISLPGCLSQQHTALSDANYTQITSVIAM